MGNKTELQDWCSSKYVCYALLLRIAKRDVSVPLFDVSYPNKPRRCSVERSCLSCLSYGLGFRYPAPVLTIRLGVTVAVTIEKLSIVIVPPPASATVRYGCFLNPRPPAHAPSTSWERVYGNQPQQYTTAKKNSSRNNLETVWKGEKHFDVKG